jgi:predicted O-methyltransferase YrrM
MSREQYVRDLYAKEDDVLVAVRESIKAKDMPAISVGPEVGKLLEILVKLTGAEKALEIGALGGYSGICLARALPANGKLVSLELLQDYADLAHENLKKAGLGDKVEYRVGEALNSLQALGDEGAKFDLFFIDADKENYINYLEWAIRLGNPGAVILADNVLWSGRVYDPENNDESTLALRAFNEKVAADERVDAIILPIGDGLTVARVK